MRDDICLDHVCFGYTSHEEVLHNVSFSVSTGQFWGIIGPNGEGKSTLLKLLLGILKPSKGTISTPPLKTMAYVPQALYFDRLFPITALEVVLGGQVHFLTKSGRFSKKSYELCYEKLSLVRLEHVANRPFSSLSHGQAQRVLLARALASNPSVLLLDEPTSSSDPAAEAISLEILTSLKGKMTILMVTHNIQTIVKFVDGVLIVQRGTASMRVGEICEHFALGLYHQPLNLQQPCGHIP